MCGIAGTFAYHPDAPPATREELLYMDAAMATRGPDGNSQWIDPTGRIGFAHRRLAILDLSDQGAQPMHSSNGHQTIVFNGEIYNYKQLKADLEARGHAFRSTCDTEVLLALWHAHGPEMVHHLRGMFAFAIWDDREQSLFLARDPFGIKPLYYADDGKTVRFASQVKTLVAGAGAPSSPTWPAGPVSGCWGMCRIPTPPTVKSMPCPLATRSSWQRVRPLPCSPFSACGTN